MSDRDKLQDMKNLIKIIDWYEIELAMKNKRFVTMAAQKGYIIHPDCDYNRVKEYLKTLPDNRNTSFYKSFDIIKSLCNEEIIQHRMSHYASTYGKFMLEPSTFEAALLLSILNERLHCSCGFVCLSPLM